MTEEDNKPEKDESSGSTESNLVHTFKDSRESSLEVIDLSSLFSVPEREAANASAEFPAPPTPEEIVSATPVGAGGVLPLQGVHQPEGAESSDSSHFTDSLEDEPSAGARKIIFVREAKEPAECPLPPVRADICPDAPSGTGQIEPLQGQKDHQTEETQTPPLIVEKVTEAETAKGTERPKSDCCSVASGKNEPKTAELAQMDEIPKTPLGMVSTHVHNYT
ncbi:hypothetical protein XENTR_v10022788 [Xenopus tropicalis]|nr:hypothetical protein XENTR_v10022788 [Xenopus tropicalis]